MASYPASMTGQCPLPHSGRMWTTLGSIDWMKEAHYYLLFGHDVGSFGRGKINCNLQRDRMEKQLEVRAPSLQVLSEENLSTISELKIGVPFGRQFVCPLSFWLMWLHSWTWLLPFPRPFSFQILPDRSSLCLISAEATSGLLALIYSCP